MAGPGPTGLKDTQWKMPGTVRTHSAPQRRFSSQFQEEEPVTRWL